jgi:hypothetical protein
MSSYLPFKFSGTSFFHWKTHTIFITNLSIWITFFSTRFQDEENHKEYFCEKTWVLKSKTPLQFLNGKNIRICFFQTWVFKPTGARQRPYKYPNDQTCVNSFSVTTQKYTRKILPKCEYSNQPELVKGLIQTQMIKHVILCQRQLNSRVLFKLRGFQVHQLKPRNNYPIKYPVSKVH